MRLMAKFGQHVGFLQGFYNLFFYMTNIMNIFNNNNYLSQQLRQPPGALSAKIKIIYIPPSHLICFSHHLHFNEWCSGLNNEPPKILRPCEKVKVKVKLFSRVWLFETPWTIAYQAPPSMGFSRQEYWSGLPFPSPGDLPNPGIEPRSPSLQADSSPAEPPGKQVESKSTYLPEI